VLYAFVSTGLYAALRENQLQTPAGILWPGPLNADRTPMPKLDDQISTLQEKLTQLKLRQKRLDERKRAVEALRERKATTRRKILVGGIVLTKVEQGEIDNEQFRAWLDQALTRADDRALFGLPRREPG
jgi:hypothetical protein